MSNSAGVGEGAAGMEDPSLHLKLEESQGTLLSRPMFVHELESIFNHGHELVQWGGGVERKEGSGESEWRE